MSILKGFKCGDCFMVLQSQESLKRHQVKFCINSKYGNVDTLNKQFQTISKGKDISLYGKKSMNIQFDDDIKDVPMSNTMQSRIGGENLDKEYRNILRQIGDKQDLKQKLQRQKKMAEDELLNLQEKEKDVVVEAKRKDLLEVIKRRQDLYNQEELLEKEIKKFERERKDEEKKKETVLDQDYLYRQGREAGKLAMQRRILQQKKRQIENNLKKKKREEQKVKEQLGMIQEIPIFIPEFRQIEKKKPNVINSPGPTPKFTSASSKISFLNAQQQPNMENINRKVKQLVPKQQSPVFYQEPIRNQAIRRSKTSHTSDSLDEEEQLFLNPSKFQGHEVTLFESLNPKNKSDQDIFIESLVAQQYDALNVLAKLPKDSQLYQAKMKQFLQMSKIRQDLKEKVQKVRLQKVRREFQFQKQMTQTQKNNLQWLDNNRKAMLHKGVNILQQKNTKFNQPELYENNSRQYHYTPYEQPRTKQNIESGNNLDPFNSNKKMPARPSSTVGEKGYRINVKNVSRYEGKGPMSVKVIVVQEGQEKPLGVFMTKYHDDLASKNEQNPYNPLLKNKRDQAGNIIFNESFQCKRNLQGLYNKNQNQIFLWIVLMEKNQQKVSLQPMQHVWYCFKLTHFGQIREGTFTLNLYEQTFPFPQILDMNRLKKKADEQITIELSEIILSNTPLEIEPQPQHTPVLQKHAFSKKSTKNLFQTANNLKSSKGTFRSLKENTLQIKKIRHKENPINDIKSQFFISNERTSPVIPTKKGEKINLNIAFVEMRTLPSYIGPLKFQISFLNSNNDSILQKQQFLAQIDDNMYNPKIKFVKKIRNEELPSSTVLVISIIGLNILTYEPGLLGFSCIHLFYNEEGEGMSTDVGRGCNLINGEYQLPVFWGNVEQYKSYSQVVKEYPYIPCTSLLISLKSNIQSQISYASYQSGKYNTIFFQVDEIQNRLFQQQQKRQIQNTKEYVKGYFKFKGVSGYNQDKLLKLLSQGLSFTEENKENKLILSNLAEYSATFGIMVNIDMIHVPQNQTNYYYFCSTCLSPPAMYYKKQDENDLIFIYKINLGISLTENLMLEDDSLNYSPPYNENTCLIVQLYRVSIKQNGEADNNIEVIGHSMIPLFDIDSEIATVNVGNKRSVIYKDQFDSKSYLKEAQSNLSSYLKKMAKGKDSGFYLQVRIMNGYFPNQLTEISPEKTGKPLRSIFQNSKGFKNTQKSVKKLIQDEFNVELE